MAWLESSLITMMTDVVVIEEEIEVVIEEEIETIIEVEASEEEIEVVIEEATEAEEIEVEASEVVVVVVDSKKKMTASPQVTESLKGKYKIQTH